MLVRIEGTRGHLVQQRLPDMGTGGIDQGDLSPASLAELPALTGSEF
jgi:hypothetical protein